MNRVTINLNALRHNLSVTNRWMENRDASWTVVTKVLCGHAPTLRALQLMGVRSMGDSRLSNLEVTERVIPDLEAWYLRVPDLSSVAHVVSLSDVSLNSEKAVIEALSAEAGRQGKRHRIVIMIELGDLREGILPGSLVSFYEGILELPNLEMIGIGANLGCLAGAVPNVDQFTQLILYRELLELKFKCKMPMISAGSTAVLPLMLDGKLPSAINHFRIGEAVFLGTDLVNGGTLPELRDDVVTVQAEIAEIKEKGLVPSVETTSISPFEQENSQDLQPGQRGHRALISIGNLDTDIGGLTPMDPGQHIAGASSDITVVNLGSNPNGLKVGDTLSFKVNYSALLRLMSSDYIDKVVEPSLDAFEESLKGSQTEVSPVVAQIDNDTSETS